MNQDRLARFALGKTFIKTWDLTCLLNFVKTFKLVATSGTYKLFVFFVAETTPGSPLVPCAGDAPDYISCLVRKSGERLLDIHALLPPGPAVDNSINVTYFAELEATAPTPRKAGKGGKDVKTKAGKIVVKLYSAKMNGLRELLQARHFYILFSFTN